MWETIPGRSGLSEEGLFVCRGRGRGSLRGEGHWPRNLMKRKEVGKFWFFWCPLLHLVARDVRQEEETMLTLEVEAAT